MTDPEDVLDACRAAGFAEGRWREDVRAGHVRLNIFTPESIVFVSTEGSPLDMGDAVNLWSSYQNNSIWPVNDTQ
ncbi:hypothetical protein [Halocatena pleomorpha]|uniref:Uncharacterized protein n=1 Tax=Halocatena pleomorpha TaxID=1785090 RepID=A0A3P3RM48_9EURY|nr:hypothetical protein [Halocatena pleomorpha]RRJ33998.1 hypothetical protein EIK79_00280 [Halocatena pleomorpha]